MVPTVRGVLDCAGRTRIWLVPLLFLVIQPAFCQEKFETPQETNERISQLAAASHLRQGDTTIGSGDLLHIDVFDVPDLSRDVRVNNTGYISMPLIPGKIMAGGLTPFQLEEKLEQLLLDNGLVSHPQVSVFVREQNSQPVTVIGAVNHPMVYQVLRPTTLLEILSDAGGIANDAGSEIILTRPARPAAAEENNAGASPGTNTPADPQIIKIKLRDLLNTGDPAYNIRVFGGDIISVPRSGVVYVAGAVQQPGGYVLNDMGEQLTTLKVVAMAHGLTPYAKSNQAVILRRNPSTGVKQEINVNLKKIMQRKTEDVRLYADDILFVPDSSGKKALYKTGEAAFGLGTGVALFRAAR
jgi:polysaccharide biosynthesis/export protein